MSHGRKLQMESLESRRLLAVDLLANVDIKNDANFIPRDIRPFNGQVLFRGNDGNTGPEPWITSGTAESTEILKDIRIGQFGSGARGFTEFGGRLYFTASNGFSGLELWVTDGTKGTTQPVADVWPGTENSAPTELTLFKDALYFFANDGESGRELYRFKDGVAERVADSVEGRSGSSGVNLTIVGDKMFFDSESSEATVAGLWVSDGTAAGTVPVTIPGIGNDDIGLMTPFGDQLVFASNAKLWVSDGTEAGSRQIEPAGDSLGFQFSSIVVRGDKLYVTDELGLHEISDSLGASTTIAASADGVTESAGKVYYWDANGLYVLSPANQPTRLVAFNSFFGAKMGGTFNVDGGMLFNAKQTLNRYQIWVTDGTPEGTKILENVTDDSSEPMADFQQIGDNVYFTATNGNFYESVWTIPAPTIEVTNPGILGDVNEDDVVNSLDIDALYAGLAISATDERFDVNEDGIVASSDVDFLIENVLQTRRGDVDLNGKVEFADFLQLSASFGQAGTSWSDGDSDGDGTVSFADFLALSANFGFDRDAIV